MNIEVVQDIRLQDEIQRIFGCVVLKEKLSKEAIDKSKQLMINKLKQISSKAYKRSVYRDPNSQQLEPKDVLSAVQQEGDIYKFKIARTLMINKARQQSAVGTVMPNLGKGAKPANYKIDDNQMSD